MKVSKRTLILLGRALEHGSKTEIALKLDMSYDIVCNVLRGLYYREDVVNEALRLLDEQQSGITPNNVSSEEQMIISKLKRSK